MKQVFFVLMMLFSSFNINGKITIDGYISNREDSTPIPNCIIYLKTNDKMIIQTKTDSCGYYYFTIYNPNFTHSVIQVSIDRQTITPTAQYGFLAVEQSELYTFDKPTRRNFEITPILNCDPFYGNIIFKKNQTIFDTIYPVSQNEIDSSAFLTDIILFKHALKLNRNKKIIIEISGHCSSDEKNVEQLSLLRSQKIKGELVKYGVNEKRILCKGYGTKKLKIQDSMIKKGKTKEEKEALHAINRRCAFKILSWDFEEGAATPTQKEGEQENLLPIKPD